MRHYGGFGTDSYRGGEVNDQIKQIETEQKLNKYLPSNYRFVIIGVIIVVSLLVTAMLAYLAYVIYKDVKEGIQILGVNSTGMRPDVLYNPGGRYDMLQNRYHGTGSGFDRFKEATNPLKYRFKELEDYANENIARDELINRRFRMRQVPVISAAHPAGGTLDKLNTDPVGYIDQNIPAHPDISLDISHQMMKNETKNQPSPWQQEQLDENDQMILDRINNVSSKYSQHQKALANRNNTIAILTGKPLSEGDASKSYLDDLVSGSGGGKGLYHIGGNRAFVAAVTGNTRPAAPVTNKSELKVE